MKIALIVKVKVRRPLGTSLLFYLLLLLIQCQEVDSFMSTVDQQKISVDEFGAFECVALLNN